MSDTNTMRTQDDNGARPDSAALVAEMKANRERNDVAVLGRLLARFNGRVARLMRGGPLTRKYKIRRDPRDVAARYLRRFVAGDWFCGGSHVARYHGGPGIGFLNFRNDRADKIRAIAVNWPAVVGGEVGV